MGRIYRRICFLRFDGQAGEASRLEFSELKEAIDAAKSASTTTDEADAILRRLLDEEGERVSEAVAFAEVLIPMLADRISPAIPAKSAGTLPLRASHRPRLGPDSAERSIADFIDDMLVQDRQPAHPISR